MTKTIAIINQKGGVGKTTTAVTLGAGLAAAGKKTLIVDLDAQGNVAISLGVDKGNGLYTLLFDGKRKAITPSGRARLDLVVSDKTTAEAKQRLGGMDFREQRLKAALDKLPGYDVVVLDAAPGVDILQIGALVACTHFLIPVGLDHLAVVGAGDALATTAGLKDVGRFGGVFLGVLPTMWERTTTESHEQLKILVEQYGRLVWPPIPRDTHAREAPAYGQTLWEYAPTTRAVVGATMGDRQVGGYQRVLARLLSEVL